MASTPSGDENWGVHPDRHMLFETHAALAWWSREQPSRSTSSLAGGGAIDAAEQSMSKLVLERPALALPSATFAMLVALQAAGARAGSEVLVSGADWPAGRAAARLIGARPVPVPVNTQDFTIDLRAIAALVAPTTRALIVTHLHGLVADVAGIRAELPSNIAVIEDCAQAFGSARGDQPAGTFGDYAAFSLGPGKAVSAGEMGLLVSANQSLHLAAVAVSQHPIRQMVSGITRPREDVLIGRPAPLAAMLAAYKLSYWPDMASQLAAIDAEVRRIAASMGATILGTGLQRPQPGCVPLAVDSVNVEHAIREALMASFDDAAELSVSPSGAVIDPDLEENDRTVLADALDRVRLASVRPRSTAAGGKACQSPQVGHDNPGPRVATCRPR